LLRRFTRRFYSHFKMSHCDISRITKKELSHSGDEKDASAAGQFFCFYDGQGQQREV